VAGVIGRGLPITAELALVSFVVALGLAILFAILAAWRPNGLVDRMITGLSLAGLSIAPYILALLLILVFAVELRVLPAIGWVPLNTSVPGNIRSIVLPCVSLGLPFGCVYVRILRGDLVDQINKQAYVETARAKGASRWRVLTRHALRNSTFTLITVAGVNLGTLFGGTVIVEQIFALPGIGRQLLWSINNQDTPVVAALVLIFAAAVVAANLLTDVMYSVLDPRVRRGRAVG
jgi:peptide/nickel transport system permease protein